MTIVRARVPGLDDSRQKSAAHDAMLDRDCAVWPGFGEALNDAEGFHIGVLLEVDADVQMVTVVVSFAKRRE